MTGWDAMNKANERYEISEIKERNAESARSAWNGLRFLLQQIKPYRRRIVLALLLSVLTVSSNIGLMATSAYLLARAALHPPVLDLMVAIVGVRFFGISRAVFRYLERYTAHDVTFRILSRLRVNVYEILEPLAPARLKNWQSGDLLSRIVGDVEIQQNLYLRVLAPPLVAVFVLIGFGLFLAPFDQRLPFIAAALFLISGLGIPLVIRTLGQSAGERKVKEKAHLMIDTLDLIQGMSELLSFGQELSYLEKIQRTQKKYSAAERKFVQIASLSGALLGMVTNFGMWIVLLFGIILVEQGRLNGVYLGMLALGMLSSFEAVQPLSTVLQYLEENRTAAGRLWELKELRHEIKENWHSTRDEKGMGREELALPSREILPHCAIDDRKAIPAIQFDHVSFRYGAGEPYALKDISFEVPWGGKVGIVGLSGAGKSSLVHLLLRFWEYETGSICLAGEKIETLNPEAVRQTFGVMMQKTHLFNATVKENLLLANPYATEGELVEACKKAKIHEFILSLPQGYDSVIGHQGFKLSGGQRQRLAIARVLLKNAPILILDEATAGLDPETERDVMQEILPLMEGRTTLVISHHLPVVQNLDEIIVLDAGKIVERGKHEELMKEGKLYKRLWENGCKL